MKIGGPSGATGASATGGSPRQPASVVGGFAPLGGAAAAAPASATAGAGAVAGVEALLALQDVGGPLERRRRMISRGGRVLDELDRVKLALLEGGDGRTAMAALQRSAAEARERDDDAGLDGVLDQIDLRAAVELAKAEARVA